MLNELTLKNAIACIWADDKKTEVTIVNDTLLINKEDIKSITIRWLKEIVKAIGKEVLLSEERINISLHTYINGEQEDYKSQVISGFDIMQTFKEDFKSAEAIKLIFVDKKDSAISRRVVLIRN